MNITIIGTGNMARGIGSRVLAGGHQLTVVGKERPAADAVAADLDAGSVTTAVTGDALEDDEELAALAPDARFVKAFNTTFAGTLSVGEVAGQKRDVLVAGDDEAAKTTVAELARDGGLNPIDAGPQKRARELEALGLLHMVVQNTLGTGYGSAVKIVA
jgi:predicted dinucleotide-binding enzyme